MPTLMLLALGHPQRRHTSLLLLPLPALLALLTLLLLLLLPLLAAGLLHVLGSMSSKGEHRPHLSNATQSVLRADVGYTTMLLNTSGVICI